MEELSWDSIILDETMIIKNWIFDLDGTLTQHDVTFDSLKKKFNIPKNVHILEYIRSIDERKAIVIRESLGQIENKMIENSNSSPNADKLLSHLRKKNCKLGILTRNTKVNAIATLEKINLMYHFEKANIIGRGEAVPKPSAEGITKLMQKWQVDKSDTVMVGDYYLDIEAGMNASVRTILINDTSIREKNVTPDFHFTSLSELLVSLSD